MLVDPGTLQHIGFAIGAVSIVLCTKALFDIAESAKQIARYYPIDEDEDEDEGASADTPAAPPASTQTIGEVGAAHVNPDITTLPQTEPTP